MANLLADMHDVVPALTAAVADRITSSELHDKALRDLGAFVHRTLVEDERTYAVRIDDGALLDAAQQVEHARPHFTATDREQLARILACEPGKLDAELDTLTARAKTKAIKLLITPETRDRARARCFAYVHPRGQDFADSIWVVNPVFIIDLVRDHLAHHHDDQPARDEAFFAGAALDDDELRAAGQEDRARRDAERVRQAEATNRNLGLGHDLRAGLMDPTPGQLQALKAIICHLLAHNHSDVIAYGAGWTDHDRQQLVGDTGRHEPRQVDAILHAELDRALKDPDPLRGIAQLTASLTAAFVLDPDGITRTQNARHRTHGPQTRRRTPRRAAPATHRRLGVPATDALPPPRRPAPRHLRARRATRNHRAARCPPRRVRPRRPRPRRRREPPPPRRPRRPWSSLRPKPQYARDGRPGRCRCS